MLVLLRWRTAAILGLALAVVPAWSPAADAAPGKAPKSIRLSKASVAENLRAGTTVGTFAPKPSRKLRYAYKLVKGPGSTGNRSFRVRGNRLRTAARFDFERKSKYAIRVRVTDRQARRSRTKKFVIKVRNVNEAPSNLALSSSSVSENQPVTTVVGMLSATDPDARDTQTFKLVAGAGGTDNGAFSIAGRSLRTSAVFDFESKSSYSIRVRATDRGGLRFEKRLTVTVANAGDTAGAGVSGSSVVPGNQPPTATNHVPSAIALSPSSVVEGRPAGTAVGALSATDEDAGDTHTFTLIGGAGAADNGSFQISGSTLQTAAVLDLSDGVSRSIRVQVSDGRGGTFEQQLTVAVTGVPAPPTDIDLSPSSVEENEPLGTLVGSLSATDPNTSDAHTFALVAGPGATDNGAFNIAGDALRTSLAFDFELKPSYSIRVRATDGAGLTFDKQLTVTVTNANDAPTDIVLSNSSVAENQLPATLVGLLSSSDQDLLDVPSFSLVAGAGDTDNDAFQIAGTALQTAEAFDAEAKASYAVRVEVSDGHGGSFEKQLTITIANVNEAPTDIGVSPSSVAEGQPVGTTVGALSASDEDTGATHAFVLVTGPGDTDNASFQISGSTLRTAAVLNVSGGATRSVRVRATDTGGLMVDKVLTISITNVEGAPTNLALSATSVAENAAVNTTVGTLSATDPDVGDTHTFTLVAGTGDTGNASFNISGTSLRTSAALNFETKSSYAIRVRVTDGAGLAFDKQLTVTVTDVNEAPTNIGLAPASVAENQAASTVVGTLSATDPDAASAFTFTLVGGAGSTDNASFNISGGSLRTSASFNFEAKASYAIRVRATDAGGLTFDKQLTVAVTNVNETPTNLALSASSVAENQAANTVVGALSATDPDAGNTHTFTLVTGTGSTDNASFNIAGGSLRTSASFNFEAKASYAIRVRATDAGGLLFDKQLTVTVTNVNEAPTNIGLSASSLPENQAANTVVGALSATDPDAGSTHTYTLVTGAGDTDNASFNISGTSLRASASLNFEAKSSYSVRVRATDNGTLTFDKAFTVTVTNVAEAPTDVALSPSSVAENQAVNTVVGALSATDPDAASAFTFTLVTGAGSTDNASFNISGASLRTSASFNRESKSSYAIRVRATDAGGLFFDKQLTVTVTNVNEAPTNVALSVSAVAENELANTVVGALSATDPDVADTHTFTLVTGAGSTDNASFNISGTSLRTSAAFNFETKSSYAIRVRATDAGGLTFDKQLTITVTNVNEAPTNSALSTSSVAENLTANTVVGTLSATDPDAASTFTFTLVGGAGSTDNASFNISGGSLRTTASFDFEAKSSYAIRVRATDAGGLFFDKQLTITVTNVNEAPTNIAVSPATVQENTATGTDVGTLSSTDQDAADTHTYMLVSGGGSTDNAKFQITGGTLERSATALNFEATPTASIRVRTTDQGGLTFDKVITITVTDANDAPVADDESFSAAQRAIGNTSLVVNDPTDAAPDPAGAQKTVTGDILAGDTDEDGNGSLAVVAGTFATNDGGSVTLEADGDFSFLPKAGTSCTDHSDFFDYTLTDQNTVKPPGSAATDVGRVTIDIQDCVWYLDRSGGAGDGTSVTPKRNLSDLTTHAAGDTIFLYDGMYSTPGGFTLKASNRVFGQRHGLTMPDGGSGTVTLEPAVPGGAPSSIGGGLELSTDNTLQGIDLGPTGTLTGTNVGNLVIDTITPGQIDTQTHGIDIDGGHVDMAFTSVSADPVGTTAIQLRNTTGTFTAAGGDLTGSGTSSVRLINGAVNFRYDGSILNDTGSPVQVTNETGGTVDFNGLVSDGGDGDGRGISLTSNTGATIRFDGGVTLSTDYEFGPAFSATGGGTLAITDPPGSAANTIASTANAALYMVGTTIAADDLTFERINASGGEQGLYLNSTGNAGGLVVTGAATPDSGGVIQDEENTGAQFSSVGGGVDLSRMRITGNGDHGISATAVNGFRFANGSVTDNGDAILDDGLWVNNPTGTYELTNATITGNAYDNVGITHDGGTFDATVTGGTIGSNSPTLGNDGLAVRSIGAGSMSLAVDGTTFTDNRGDHLQMSTDADATVAQNLTVDGSTFTTTPGADPTVLGGGITVNPGGSSTAEVALTNNDIQQAFDSAIVVSTPGSTSSPQPVQIDATITGNTIGTAAAADSGSESGDGISLFSSGMADVDALITNNQIRQYSNLAGIDIKQNDGNGTLDATVRGNTISNPGTFATNGIFVTSGLASGTQSGQTCVDLGHASTPTLKNSLTGSGKDGNTDMRIRQQSNTTVRLPGYGGTAGDNAAVASYLVSRNNPVPTPTASATNTFGSGGAGFLTAASCTLP